MEGVLVSAKKAGSTITITVVSDAQGRYSFPAGKLEPGQYALRIRAVGYDLDNSKHGRGRRAEDHHARSQAAQDRGSGGAIVERRMAGQHSRHRSAERHPARVRRLPHPRAYHALAARRRHLHEGRAAAHAGLRELRASRRIRSCGAASGGWRSAAISASQVYRAAAEYLSTINLSSGSPWTYELKTLPRPSGRATRVIYTEYDLGREVIQPHDVIVDADGIAWYSSFGEQNLGRLDPKTGAVKEYPVPLHKPGFPTGFLGLRDDKAGNLWLGNMYQATIVKFDRKTEKFQFWPLPPEQNIDAAQVNMVSPQSSHVDGKVWTQNNGFAGVHRLDIATGKIETWEPFKNAKEPHNIYDVIPDSKNNVYFTDFRWRHIGRIDAKTGEVKLFEVPTPASAPRRGQMDAQDRLWFGEYRGDRIAMFDTKTEQFKEWKVPPRWSAPYDVAIDKNEEAWTGSMITDQVTRLNTKSGELVDYLLPRPTNIRRVFVDSTTTPVTFWVGSNHGASIIKLEPLD